MSKKTLAIFSVTWLVILVAGASVAGTLAICGFLGDGIASSEAYTVTAEQYDMIRRYERLEEVYQILKTEYVEPLDDQALMDGAAQGMMTSIGNPYTFYYTVEDMTRMNEQEEGSYEGIGLQISITDSGLLMVTRVFKDTPSLRAGIQAGDYLIAINDTPVAGTTSKDLTDAVQMIQHDEDGLVHLTLVRDGEEYSVNVERAPVTVNRVEYAMLDDHVGYIMLYEFHGDAVEGFDEAVAELQKQGMTQLVLDLRSNPGGSLGAVLKIADKILPEGLILYIEDRGGNRSDYRSDAKNLGIPLAILVNGNSASASEVLTGAVQDHGVGVVVGEITFGKGIVQSVYTFEDGAGLQLTIARYYTPSGRYIHGVGIEPDIQVALEEGYDPSIHAPDPANDAQLAAAISALEKGK